MAEKKAAKAEAAAEDSPEAKAKCEKSKAKRVEQRGAKVDQGIEELRIWLEDLIRQGFAELENKRPDYWEQMSQRLVDAQAPGLARLVSHCSLLVDGDRWQERLIHRIGVISLITESFQNKELPPQVMDDLRNIIGFPVKKEDVFANGDIVNDTWVILGQITEGEERLRARRSWALGLESQQEAFFLDFAYGTGALPAFPATGQQFEAEVAFYSGTVRQRALLKSRRKETSSTSMEPWGSENFEEAFLKASELWAKNPWIESIPMAVKNCNIQSGSVWKVIDSQGRVLPIASTQMVEGQDWLWSLLAMSSGYPLWVFGVWDGDRFKILSAQKGGYLMDVDAIRKQEFAA